MLCILKRKEMVKMKAIKGCVNRECESFTKKKAYKDKFKFCPICGEELEYVCSDCWKVLEHNTEKYCISCKMNHEQKKAQQADKVKAAGATIAGVATVAWKNKDKIVEVGKNAVKIIKK